MRKPPAPSEQIIPLTELPVGIDRLCAEALTDGFRFMEKLRNGWRSGANRFDAPGEIFLGIFRGPDLVAVGGLNIDPYLGDVQIGRLRHLYVAKADRRNGYATHLVDELVRNGRATFRRIRLFTDTAGGAAFYEARGFTRVSSPTASHELVLGP